MFKLEKDLRVTHKRKGGEGTIVEVDSQYEVQVLWDGQEEAEYQETEMLSPLLPEDKARYQEHVQLIQEKVKAVGSAIEEAFKQWSEAIALANGWDEPSDSKEGAWKLRSIEGLDLSEFENTLEDYGWSTSSLYC